MSKSDFDTLQLMRQQFPGQPEMQGLISPFEHRAWLREVAGDGRLGPAKSLALAAASPFYQMYKASPFYQKDAYSSPPSLEQSWQALLGALEGTFSK